MIKNLIYFSFFKVVTQIQWAHSSIIAAFFKLEIANPNRTAQVKQSVVIIHFIYRFKFQHLKRLTPPIKTKLVLLWSAVIKKKKEVKECT